MSEQLVRTSDYQPGDAALQPWQDSRGGSGPAVPPRSPIERPLAAIRRYKWLMLGIVLVATIGGVVATRLVKPAYEVRATIMITGSNGLDDRSGPIRQGAPVSGDDWVQLLRDSRIVDAVVRKLNLYLEPADDADKWLFKGFKIGDRGIIGKFALTIDQTHKTWRLEMPTESSVPPDSGSMADSVGRRFGFLWVLPRAAFYGGKAERKVDFTILTPRESALKLASRLAIRRQEGSNLMFLTFQDPDPALAAATVNAWLDQYMLVAAELKKRRLVDFTGALATQVSQAKGTLDDADMQLSSFRINTITEPHEDAPVAGGLASTTDQVTSKYLSQKVDLDNLTQDIHSLEAAINAPNRDSTPNDAMLQIPSVAAGGPAAQPLHQAFQDYNAAASALARDRLVLQDAHPQIKLEMSNLATIRAKIPAIARDLLANMKTRAHDDSTRIANSGVNLQKIPQRTIDEERFRRRRDLAATIYGTLESRYAEAQMAEAGSTPDVTILDSAIAPFAPTNNTGPKLVLMAIVVGLGAAIALAILLDKIDGKFRYPEQSEDLGLPIAGTVPQFPKGGLDQRSTEQMFQLVESFRTLRMSVLQASNGGVSVAISSAAPGEGKSLISANLAMSFADAGLRTVLVDGDTRRGTLHQMFGVPSAPGLTDYLAESATFGEVVLPTNNDHLFVVPCGTRQGRSPELLTSPRLRDLVAQLRTQFDAVLFDTPPLAAGIDGYSIATAAGSLLVVLRVGQTQRRMAGEKLRVLDRLPVDIVGSVLNGVDFRDGYEYYGYVPGYEASDEPGTAVTQVT